MDKTAVRKWLTILMIVLVLLSVGWGLVRWSETRALLAVMGGSKTEDLKTAYLELRDRPDSVGGHWLRTLNPLMKDVQGDLIWSTQEQRGVMRFLNLPNPRRGQNYLLWIYDAKSTEPQPVLGAVLQRGSGKFERFVAFGPDRSVIEPYKFMLTMAEGQVMPGDDGIMLMVQP